MGGWMDGRMDGWMDGLIGEWMSRRIEERIDRGVINIRTSIIIYPLIYLY